MISKEEAISISRELSKSDRERAIQFNETDVAEEITLYSMLIEQKKLPRLIFIHGYKTMFSKAALFLARNYSIKIDSHVGNTHKNMRDLIEYYTQDSQQNKKLLSLYELAIDRFQSMNEQYSSSNQFAKKVTKDLMYQGYDKGKKKEYYSTTDHPDVDISDANKFIQDVVEPFMFIMDNLTND